MKIAVVKEPSLLREGVIKILQEHFCRYEIEAYSSNDYGKLVEEANSTDLIIIDIDTKLNIHSLIDLYIKRNKKVIVWIPTINQADLPVLFKLKLDGYFYNGINKEELLFAISSVLDGKSYIDQSLSQILLGYYAQMNQPEKPDGVFSHREWEVIELLAKGYKNEQIANFLYISEKTVKNYVSAIMKKMNVSDRTNIVLTAIKNNWVVL
ncbi:response regulator transcription factor [Aquibacillus sediminis]|uniref:response regulator transcription factor n=1 Tax=Aquibacillus sediminis TaxID=2574734 RepID=UPI001109EF22|nr:response regulator transcription factor [Aquibacillus sediminis]